MTACRCKNSANTPGTCMHGHDVEMAFLDGEDGRLWHVETAPECCPRCPAGVELRRYVPGQGEQGPPSWAHHKPKPETEPPPPPWERRRRLLWALGLLPALGARVSGQGWVEDKRVCEMITQGLEGTIRPSEALKLASEVLSARRERRAIRATLEQLCSPVHNPACRRRMPGGACNCGLDDIRCALGMGVSQ